MATSFFFVLPRCSFLRILFVFEYILVFCYWILPVSIDSGLMARQKQATPLQRATSSELMHILPDEDGIKQRHQNGGINKTVANGEAKGTTNDSAETPGLLQLVTCVLGIYASLYVTCACAYWISS